MQNWLYPGWESLSVDDLPACFANLDLIKQASAKLAQKNIRCLVVITPIKARMSEQNLPTDKPLSNAVRNRYAAMLDYAKKIDLLMSDSNMALLDMQKSATPHDAFYRTDYHWTAYAAEAAAASVANQLKAFGALEGRAGTGVKLEKWRDEVRYGNLATLLPLDRQKAVGKEHYMVRIGVDSANSTNLLDTEPQYVHIVGNSMVQPYLGFTQKLSQAIDRQVGLTWAFGNIGPWITLAKYLESPEFSQLPPRTIIWQFNEGQMMNGPNANGLWDAASLMTKEVWLNRIGKVLR
jgi:alginate O-acetyltransferase complex protein AlgJ